jgi:hypothetical protein
LILLALWSVGTLISAAQVLRTNDMSHLTAYVLQIIYLGVGEIKSKIVCLQRRRQFGMKLDHDGTIYVITGAAPNVS